LNKLLPGVEMFTISEEDLKASFLETSGNERKVIENIAR
jgi:hypothetical protein